MVHRGREDNRGTRAQALNHGLIAPDLILYEIFSAVSTATRRHRAPASGIDQLPSPIPGVFTRLEASGSLFLEAAQLSRQYDHPIYDTAYLALTRRANLPLVTADERQFAVAREARIPARLL